MALGAWVLLLTAWVCDDAYIGFRVVDNLINGYGLRWNVDGRVQAFSNPMWVLLLAPAYAITHEIYYTSLAMSALASLATLWVLLRRCSDSLMAGLLVTVALVLSPAFVEFSTSGLENALTHLLVVMFCASYFADDTAPARKAFALALLAALAAFNRLDSALLLGVPLAVFVIRHRSRAVFRALLLGALPLVAWEMFSLVYYGALVPNTAFAKLATGIPSRELIAQGATYFRVSAAFDPVGAGLLVLAVVAAPIVDRRLLPVALGIAT